MPLPLTVSSVKSRLVLHFWYWPTWVVPEKGPLNGCVCTVVRCSGLLLGDPELAHESEVLLLATATTAARGASEAPNPPCERGAELRTDQVDA